jgi:hypothetical protein
MLRWVDLIPLSDELLASQDIASVNLACAAGLPTTEGLDGDACLRVIDTWAEHVRGETARCAAQFHANPSDFENSWGYFRVLVMTTVLQQDFGVRYDPLLVDRDDFFTRPEHLFVHGVVQGKGGTCTSLPPLYVAVGRRLGYPLKLVQTHSHLFARWDNPATKDRFNIECTARGLNCYPDDYYRNWPRPTSERYVERYGWLVSQTPREYLAWFLVTRGHCLMENGYHREAVEAYALAVKLTARHRGYEGCVELAIRRWLDHLAGESPTGTSQSSTPLVDPHFPWLSVHLQREIATLQAMEALRDRAAG